MSLVFLDPSSPYPKKCWLLTWSSELADDDGGAEDIVTDGEGKKNKAASSRQNKQDRGGGKRERTWYGAAVSTSSAVHQILETLKTSTAQRERERWLTRFLRKRGIAPPSVSYIWEFWSLRPIRLFAYEAGTIKLLVSGRLCMSSSGYLVGDIFFLPKKRRYLNYIPGVPISASSQKSHFKPPKSWMPWGPFNNCPLV